MGFNSLQVCMDSSDWLQGAMSEDGGLDSSSSPTGQNDMLACSRPLMERRLRPPHDQILKCPRCESTHTKFCYYNNYSLSQPRYFCKTCRRYWTKGGTLRNIPVGGGCRKNKKSSSGGGGSNSKKSSSATSSLSSNDDHLHLQQQQQNVLNVLQSSIGLSSMTCTTNPTELQLSFPHDQATLSHFGNLIGVHSGLGDIGFMESKYSAMLENSNGNSSEPRPIDFMQSKFDALVATHHATRGHDFMGNGSGSNGGFGNIIGGINGPGNLSAHGLGSNENGLCSSPFGHLSMDGSNGNGVGGFLDPRLMLPFDVNDHHQNPNSIDLKPNPSKLLSLEWQDHQGCPNNHNINVMTTKDSLGYNNVGGLSSWSGMVNAGYGTSTTNPLV